MRNPKISADEFAERVEKAYDGRISVVKETYTGTRYQVTAYCNIHKIYFEVKEARSLTRHFVECPECLKEIHKQVGENKIKDWKQVLETFIEKYGNKFSYNEESYNGRKVLMKVHCNECGKDFEITPEHHLKYNNGGCPNCHKYKTIICKQCGKSFKVDRRHPNSESFICDECHKKEKKYINQEEKHQYELNRRREQSKNRLYICPCCGQPHKYKEKCQTSELCRRHPNRIWYKNLIPFGFDYSKIGTPEYVNEYYKALEVIKTEYFENKLSSQQIFEKYNCREYFKYESVIRNILKTENITIRNICEAQHNAIENGKSTLTLHSYQYKTEYHKSWENKTFLLRSSYEIDYANILDEQHISYDVETLRIYYFDTQQKHKRIAIPDFYLPETNTIVEIKSDWTLDVINMLDKVKAYKELGYNFKLILEHKEVDIYSLINEPIYKAQGKNHLHSNCAKTIIKGEKWHWMNDSINNYKVPESQIKEYEEKGFVFGCLMNIRNKPKSVSFIEEIQKYSQDSNPPTSPPKSNPLF